MYERYFLMRLILYIEQKDRLHVLVIWTLKFSCETNQTPRFRALFTVATLVSPTVRVRKLTLLSCWRVPINMTSDLFSLGLREVINLCLCHQTVTKCNNLVQLWNFLFFSEAQGHFLSNGMGFILIILHRFSLPEVSEAGKGQSTSLTIFSLFLLLSFSEEGQGPKRFANHLLSTWRFKM